MGIIGRPVSTLDQSPGPTRHALPASRPESAAELARVKAQLLGETASHPKERLPAAQQLEKLKAQIIRRPVSKLEKYQRPESVGKLGQIKAQILGDMGDTSRVESKEREW